MNQTKKDTNGSTNPKDTAQIQLGKLAGLTVTEWREIAEIGGGCVWVIIIATMILAIVIDPTRLESLDQFIVGFGGAVIGYYLGRNTRHQ